MVTGGILMTLPFYEEIINDKEYSTYNFEHPNFIGYLNDFGEVLEYSDPLGFGGHDCDRTTAFFEKHFSMPMHNSWLQQFEGINVIDIESEKSFAKERYKYFKQMIEHNADKTREYGKSDNVRSKLLYDLKFFFYNCYQAPTFMDGFGQNCMILNMSEFSEMYCEGRYRRNIDCDYHWYKKNTMLDWYKTVIVQYMHYHLVERCKKGITTSDFKPNETFYNYLLNDFEIHQIPRMIYDNDKKMYVPYIQNEFLIPDSELRLKEEINAIKKLVPLKEREKYYR